MRYEIRAMSFAEILDMGFRLLRDHFLLVVGLAATLQVPLAVLQAWAGARFAAHSAGAGQIAAAVLVALGIIVVGPAVGAAVTYALGETYLGRSATMGGALGRAFRILKPLIGTMLLVWLVVLAGALVSVLPFALVRFTVSAPVPRALAVVVLVPIALFTVFYLIVAFMLTTQVMVLEQRFGGAALRRSRALMRGNVIRGLGVTTVGALIVGVLGGVLQLALGFVPLVGPVAKGLTQAAATGYTSAVLVVLYFDIRCRKEAFDLDHLADLVAGAPA